MNKFIRSLLPTVGYLLSCAYQAQAQAPPTLWDHTFGGNQSEAITSLQQTTDGGYILGGSSTSDISGDKTQPSRGGSDFWVVKLDATGTKLWDRTLGGNSYEALNALHQTRDGGYVLGGGSISPSSGDKTQASQGFNDFWLVKLGPSPLATVRDTPPAGLGVFPNPTLTTFTLRGPTGTPYQLLNQLGQVVHTGRVSSQPVDVQALPAGLYLLRDQTSGRTSKLVKK